MKGSLQKFSTSENNGGRGQFPREKLSEKISGAFLDIIYIYFFKYIFVNALANFNYLSWLAGDLV